MQCRLGVASLLGILVMCNSSFAAPPKPAQKASLPSKNLAIPPEIRSLVFNRQEFTDPVTLSAPALYDRARVKALQAAGRDVHRAPTTFGLIPGVESPGPWSRGSSVLRRAGLIDILPVRVVEESRPSWFLALAVSTPKTAQYFLAIDTYRTNGQFRLASRELTAITFVNTYKANPMGMGERTIFAFTFSYRFREIPGLPALPRTFQGKAKLQQDPDDGTWKVEELKLSDAGGNEYEREFGKEIVESDFPDSGGIVDSVSAPSPTTQTGDRASQSGSTSPCPDYNSCLSTGEKALKEKDWNAAIAAFRAATVADPKEKTAWEQLAIAQLAAGNPKEEIFRTWDSMLSSGMAVSLPMCRGKVFNCEVGVLTITKGAVSFSASNKKTLITGAPAQFTPKGLKSGSVPIFGTKYTAFILSESGKDHTFFFMPPNGEKCTHAASWFCEGNANAQQAVAGEYVSVALKALSETK
jgi:hypothetical protein